MVLPKLSNHSRLDLSLGWLYKLPLSLLQLDVNDTLQLKDNSIVVIDNKIIFSTFIKVYNLEIEDNENYYVTEGGVLVHNGCREEYVGRTPGKNSRTGREVFDRM